MNMGTVQEMGKFFISFLELFSHFLYDFSVWKPDRYYLSHDIEYNLINNDIDMVDRERLRRTGQPSCSTSHVEFSHGFIVVIHYKGHHRGDTFGYFDYIRF